MTPDEWFAAYRDGVEVAGLLMRCTTPSQAEAYWNRTCQEFAAAKGLAHTDAMLAQVRTLVDGVAAMHAGEDA